MDENSPWVYECPVCGNSGKCKYCNDEGRLELTQCPRKAITNDIWQFMDYAELYEKGIPPEHGGALDQLYAFNYYCRFVWNEQALHKAKAHADILGS